MPRNVRNFWLELDVDGRKSAVKTGPRSRRGGFALTVFIRNRGSVELAGKLIGTAHVSSDGTGILDLRFDRGDNHQIVLADTKR